MRMRVKGWLMRLGSGLFLALMRFGLWILPVLFAVDSFILRNYQRFIADPLQIRGFSLRRQFQAIWIIGAFYALLQPPLSLLNLIGFVGWLANAFFCVPSFLDAPPTEELCRNPASVSVITIFYRCAVYWIAVLGLLVIRISPYAFVFGSLLSAIVIIVSCDVKPPRPKRVRILVSATEGA